MTNKERLKSRMELVNFINNNAIKTSILADVIYVRDKISTKFPNITVYLSSNSSDPGIVTLEELDTNDYYTEFKTDFQKFKCTGTILRISGTGNGNKPFTSYDVTIKLCKKL